MEQRTQYAVFYRQGAKYDWSIVPHTSTFDKDAAYMKMRGLLKNGCETAVFHRRVDVYEWRND